MTFRILLLLCCAAAALVAPPGADASSSCTPQEARGVLRALPDAPAKLRTGRLDSAPVCADIDRDRRKELVFAVAGNGRQLAALVVAERRRGRPALLLTRPWAGPKFRRSRIVFAARRGLLRATVTARRGGSCRPGASMTRTWTWRNGKLRRRGTDRPAVTAPGTCGESPATGGPPPESSPPRAKTPTAEPDAGDSGQLRLLHAPSIAGQARVGHELTCSPGVWSPAQPGTKALWLRGRFAFGRFQPAAVIAGARSARYTVTAADLGYALSCRSTLAPGVNADAEAVAVAARNLTAPHVRGDALQSRELTCDEGAWEGVTGRTWQRTVRWERDGRTVQSGPAAAGGHIYRVQAADVGRQLRCVVTVVTFPSDTNSPMPVSAPATDAASGPVTPGACRAWSVPFCADPPSDGFGEDSVRSTLLEPSPAVLGGRLRTHAVRRPGTGDTVQLDAELAVDVRLGAVVSVTLTADFCFSDPQRAECDDASQSRRFFAVGPGPRVLRWTATSPALGRRWKSVRVHAREDGRAQPLTWQTHLFDGA